MSIELKVVTLVLIKIMTFVYTSKLT